MSNADPGVMIVNGWTLLMHPLFSDQLDELSREVETLKHKYPEKYQTKNATKRLAAIKKLVFEIIPSDPTKTEYRQGNTLGKTNRHWFRAKFYQQYRLFFRYDTKTKILIFVWVNDDTTLRAYNSKSDAYSVFQSMLAGGNPPNNFVELKQTSSSVKSKFIKRLLG